MSSFNKIYEPMKIITLLFILFLSGIKGYSQKLCGVQITPERVSFERARLSSLPPSPASTISNAVPKCCLGKTLSMTMWVVKDSTGQPNISNATLTQAVSNLNAIFAPICLSFSICSINYIDDWNYDSLYFPDENEQLYALYRTANTINVYWSRTIATDPVTTVAGLGSLPGGSETIFMTKGSALGKTFAHETGHFFGLHHTFETSFGAELVDGSNCTTAGDLVCDTPADPHGGNTPAPDCQLDPYTKDANGDWYVPQIGNIMSYYSDDCSCGFTVGQYDRMCQQYLTLRFNLW
jgi:hypothetical protein